MPLLKLPIFHFIILGALFYGLKVILFPIEDNSNTATIVITENIIKQQRENWRNRTGRYPTDQEQITMVETIIQDKLLFREALARRFTHQDRVIRQRLISNMRFLNEDTQASDEQLYQAALDLGLMHNDDVIQRYLVEQMKLFVQSNDVRMSFSDVELQDYLERHNAQFMQAARIRISHVYFNTNHTDKTIEHTVYQLLAQLRNDSINPQQAALMADPFFEGHHWPLRSQQEIAKIAGPQFAKMIMSLPVGRWLGPIRSVYGSHLVWVHDKSPAKSAILKSVYNRVYLGLSHERRKQRLQNFINQLKTRYTIRIEPLDKNSTSKIAAINTTSFDNPVTHWVSQ